jgi:hypothetical protein
MHEHAAELAAAQHAQRRLRAITGGRSRVMSTPGHGASSRARLGLRGAEGRQALRAAPASAVGQHGHGEQRRVGRPGRADGKRRHRDALGHLHDGVQRVHPCRWRLATGTPSTGTVVLAASMPGRWAAPPAPAMMARQPAPARLLGVARTCRRACGGPRPRGARARRQTRRESRPRAFMVSQSLAAGAGLPAARRAPEGAGQVPPRAQGRAVRHVGPHRRHAVRQLDRHRRRRGTLFAYAAGRRRAAQSAT